MNDSGICLSESHSSHLAHLTPVASIFLQFTELHSSLWPGKARGSDSPHFPICSL